MNCAPDTAPMDFAGAVTGGRRSCVCRGWAPAQFSSRSKFRLTHGRKPRRLWASRLATTINIVRFYEALPILLLTCQDPTAAEQRLDRRTGMGLRSVPRERAQCRRADSIVSASRSGLRDSASPSLQHYLNLQHRGTEGVARPVTARDSRFASGHYHGRPGDVSGNVDLKQLNKLWEEIRSDGAANRSRAPRRPPGSIPHARHHITAASRRCVGRKTGRRAVGIAENLDRPGGAARSSLSLGNLLRKRVVHLQTILF